ncbi:FIPS3/FIPS5-like protein [Aduncisulcus paluster]|uniref:FIPS3/FIPS5-like protein n=1 Tax=Aduncisulcus paluster TaxID=2918883 RepID=A0ABQ5K248_9EUKA|nr:FIPS3/FIPS5-like protein [Aduncisulcus paluster]
MDDSESSSGEPMVLIDQSSAQALAQATPQVTEPITETKTEIEPGMKPSGIESYGAPTDSALNVAFHTTRHWPAPMYKGKHIFEVNIEDLADAPWRRGEGDITDYFNYGFTEETWKLYCRLQMMMRKEVSILYEKGIVRQPKPAQSHRFKQQGYGRDDGPGGYDGGRRDGGYRDGGHHGGDRDGGYRGSRDSSYGGRDSSYGGRDSSYGGRDGSYASRDGGGQRGRDNFRRDSRDKRSWGKKPFDAGKGMGQGRYGKDQRGGGM